MVEGCGLVVEPEQPDKLYIAINMLAKDAALRRKFGAVGRAYAEENLDRDAVLGRFEAELKKLMGKK